MKRFIPAAFSLLVLDALAVLVVFNALGFWRHIVANASRERQTAEDQRAKSNQHHATVPGDKLPPHLLAHPLTVN